MIKMPYYSQYPQRRQQYQRRTLAGQGSYRSYARPVYVPRPRLRGSGAYTLENGPWAKRGAAVGSTIGGMYGGPIGKAIGGWVGRRAAHYPARLFGSGAYGVDDRPAVVPDRSIHSPPKDIAPQVPTFRKGTDDSVVITHKEYLGDLTTSGTAGGFKINQYALNPSEANTFPWLSSIAQPNFQQYKFEGLAFEFKSFSADALNSTNTALGSVFACINYDYTDANLNSRYEVENTDWSMSAKPSESMLVPVECKSSQTGLNGGLLYVLNGINVPPGTDPKTYFLGKLWIGTSGFQGTDVNIGSLYVTYKIRLYKPVMTRPLSNANIVTTSINGASVASGYFGTAISQNVNNCDTLGVTYFGNIMTISHTKLIVGQMYMLHLRYIGASTANVGGPNISIGGGSQGFAYFDNYTLSAVASPEAPATSTSLHFSVVFHVDDNSVDTTITLTSAGPVLPTSNVLSLMLVQLNGSDLSSIGSV